jgi:hypothetical protein
MQKESLKREIQLRKQLDASREQVDNEFDRIEQSYAIYEEAYKAAKSHPED